MVSHRIAYNHMVRALSWEVGNVDLNSPKLWRSWNPGLSLPGLVLKLLGDYIKDGLPLLLQLSQYKNLTASDDPRLQTPI